MAGRATWGADAVVAAQVAHTPPFQVHQSEHRVEPGEI